MFFIIRVGQFYCVSMIVCWNGVLLYFLIGSIPRFRCASAPIDCLRMRIGSRMTSGVVYGFGPKKLTEKFLLFEEGGSTHAKWNIKKDNIF